MYTHIIGMGVEVRKSYLFNVTAVRDLSTIYALDTRSDE
jgi:hypothetical protein